MSASIPEGCVPCSGGVEALSEEQARAFQAEVPEWELAFPRLRRTFELKDFRQALAWVNRVGMLAEQQAHHPDLHIRNWNEVEIELYTHKIEGLSINDFVLAKKIDGLAK